MNTPTTEIPDDMPEHYIEGIREALADIGKSAETAMALRQSKDFKLHALEIFSKARNIITMCETGLKL